MSSRHRPRQDSYGYWQPNDSDSDYPRQTMATTQRHNVDQHAGSEAPRRHRSSRRADAVVDPLDPAAVYPRHHKASSKERSSNAQYYVVPPSPGPSVQYQSQNAQYDLRAYLKKKSDKRSPQSSNEKVLSADEPKTSRSARPSRHAYPTATAYAQPTAPSQSQPVHYTQPVRDPTSSSRPHRDRESGREKSSRDPDIVKAGEPTAEKSEEKERRRRERKEREREKEAGTERTSKDRTERHREKRRDRDTNATPAAEARPPDAPAAYQAPYAAAAPTAQRSTDRIPVAYTVRSFDITYSMLHAESYPPALHN